MEIMLHTLLYSILGNNISQDYLLKNMDLINQIPNIKDTEPLSYPFEMIIDDLRSDDEVMEEIPIDDLLRNCDQYEGREVEVPKVVG